MSVVDRDVTLETRVDESVSRRHHPITVDGKFFLRGDTRFDFRGVTYGTFRPRSSDAQQFPEASRVNEDLAAIDRAGFNVVRTYVEPRGDVLEAIGEHGLYTLAGIFWPDCSVRYTGWIVSVIPRRSFWQTAQELTKSSTSRYGMR